MAKIIPLKDGTKKDAITRKASMLFRQKGFSATSMRNIAEAIGVEASSLYNHIRSKKEILQEICFKIARLFTEYADETGRQELSASGKLEKIIRFHIRMMLEEYEFVYVSEHEWKHLSEPYLSDFKDLRKFYRLRLAAIIENGIAGKEFKAIDPHVAVLIILSAIGGIENWQRSKKNIDPQVLGESMVKFLLRGLKDD